MVVSEDNDHGKNIVSDSYKEALNVTKETGKAFLSVRPFRIDATTKLRQCQGCISRKIQVARLNFFQGTTETKVLGNLPLCSLLSIIDYCIPYPSCTFFLVGGRSFYFSPVTL